MTVPKNENLFRATESLPFHLSYCAIIYHPDTKTVLCHKLWDVVQQKWIYYLMSETAEPDETIIRTIDRGIKEEFGIEVDLSTLEFAGSRNSQMFSLEGMQVNKTSVYFIVNCSSQEIHRSETDREANSEAVFVPLKDLIAISSQNGLFEGKVDLDESMVLQNVFNWLNS